MTRSHIRAPQLLTLPWAPTQCPQGRHYYLGWCSSTPRTWTTRAFGLWATFAKADLWCRCFWRTSRRHRTWRELPSSTYISLMLRSSSTPSITTLASLNTTIYIDSNLLSQEKGPTLNPTGSTRLLEAANGHHSSTRTCFDVPNAAPVTWLQLIIRTANWTRGRTDYLDRQGADHPCTTREEIITSSS